jgi:hypothetical protein
MFKAKVYYLLERGLILAEHEVDVEVLSDSTAIWSL